MNPFFASAIAIRAISNPLSGTSATFLHHIPFACFVCFVANNPGGPAPLNGLRLAEFAQSSERYVAVPHSGNSPWIGLIKSKYVLMNRDTKFTESFRATLKNAGAEPLLLPPRSPNLNAYIERFMRSVKSECLDRMIFFNEQQLRNAIREYLAHYDGERNHQGLGNQIIEPTDDLGVTGALVRRERLGGLLNFYHRRAA